MSRLRWLILILAMPIATLGWITLYRLVGLPGVVVFAVFGLVGFVRIMNRISYGDPEGPR